MVARFSGRGPGWAVGEPGFDPSVDADVDVDVDGEHGEHGRNRSSPFLLPVPWSSLSLSLSDAADAATIGSKYSTICA